MRLIRLLFAVVLAVAPISLTHLAHAAPSQHAAQHGIRLPADASKAPGFEQTVLDKVNELRSGLGLSELTRVRELDDVARDWSRTMAGRGKISHRPAFADHYPAGWTRAAENVAMRGGGVAEGNVGTLIFDQWLNSPGHYANMVDPDLNYIGIGLFYVPEGNAWYATQNFASYPSSAGLTLSRPTVEPARPKPSPSQEESPKASPSPTAKKSPTPSPSASASSSPSPSPSPTPSASSMPSTMPPSAPAELIADPTPKQSKARKRVQASAQPTTPANSPEAAAAQPAQVEQPLSPAAKVGIVGSVAASSVVGASALFLIIRRRTLAAPRRMAQDQPRRGYPQ